MKTLSSDSVWRCFSPAQWRQRAAALGWRCLLGLMRNTWHEGISEGSETKHHCINTHWSFMWFDSLRVCHVNICARRKRRLCVDASYRILHHREEEKGSDVAKAVDVLMDGGEGFPQIFCPLQHHIPPLICLDCGDKSESSHKHVNSCGVIRMFTKSTVWPLILDKS